MLAGGRIARRASSTTSTLPGDSHGGSGEVEVVRVWMSVQVHGGRDGGTTFTGVLRNSDWGSRGKRRRMIGRRDRRSHWGSGRMMGNTVEGGRMVDKTVQGRSIKVAETEAVQQRGEGRKLGEERRTRKERRPSTIHRIAQANDPPF